MEPPYRIQPAGHPGEVAVSTSSENQADRGADSSQLVRDDTFELLTDALREVLPIPDTEQVQTLTVIGGKDGGVESERRFRFLNRERTASAVVARNATTVETTDYSEFDDFRSLVLTVADAVATTTSLVGIERIGLRYIDEIRVPEEIPDTSGWRGWISDDVVGVVGMADGFNTSALQTVLRLVGEDSTGVVLRYAAMIGDGVVGDGPLRRRATASAGPFFVIDTDSFRTSAGPAMEDFEHDRIAGIFDVIHEPVGTLFHRAITDRLREEFTGDDDGSSRDPPTERRVGATSRTRCAATSWRPLMTVASVTRVSRAARRSSCGGGGSRSNSGSAVPGPR
jgi:uncharacterized protein (TIGR04255 family)